MIELTAQEQAFGKKLAHIDKDVRDSALASIRHRFSTENDIAYIDMLRHWKALFYCFWLSDMPLVQQELAWDLADLILVCSGDNRVQFVRAFWETVCREWFDIDKHRLDKYLLLMRRVVFFTFRSMQRNSWDRQLVSDYLKVYQEYPVNSSEPKVPNSIRTHVADVYIDEMVRLVATVMNDGEAQQGESSEIPVATLLEPFIRFIGCSTIKHLPSKIQESVFMDTVVRIAEAEERANAENNSDSEDSVQDIGRDNQMDNEEVDQLQFLIDAIPAIKKNILDVCNEEGIRAIGRRQLYSIYQMLTETFPDEENDVVFPERVTVRKPIGPEERKIANKHRRKKENKRREYKEKLKSTKALARSMVSTSADNLDINALVNEATLDEERKYQEDIIKIREMEKRAGFGTTEDSGTKPPASKKSMRAEKKKESQAPSKASTRQEEIPVLIPAAKSRSRKPSTPVDTEVANVASALDASKAAEASSENGEWIVSKKDSKAFGINSTQKRKRASGASLLSETEASLVVREKHQTAAEGKASSAKKTLALKENKSNSGTLNTTDVAGSSQSAISTPEKKRLSWALDRNLTKRFITKVPMLPSLEPLTIASETDLKPALRKVSAYADSPSAAEENALLKPLKPVKVIEHAKELGNAVPAAPFFFLKPTSSYVTSPGKIEIPRGCVVHHEVELGVVIGKSGRNIRAEDAYEHVAGYALALDLTARNLQEKAKAQGLPWSAAKGYDTFTPIGEFIPASTISDPHNVRIWIEVAGQLKQNGATDAMIFRIPQLIEHVSQIMTLEEGDLLLTGTPKGVGPIESGDRVVAGLEYGGEELGRIEFDAIARD
ncbi:hypothetical protein GGI26_003714 [Coemansia sp. RSA 1358]|uniref:Fumarylacetoacetase-like C-terminal domain-containing protein n=1 Tax=Coemansia umbellata TaxID=1424467 RepID=A0ABQ8PLS9_9FUNG|nr:hypothetical protein EDC05_003175 [Coemansia umbellata]KAJ2621871.1 hypothetical protein GGI26_003714 [Coemansia sp. RSA 1358]